MNARVSFPVHGAELDSGIAPLVSLLNELGCPTCYSCEGHGRQSRHSARSSFPMVILSPVTDALGAFSLMRVMGMLGLHNDGESGMRWALLPNAHGGVMLRPLSRHLAVEEYQAGVSALVADLEDMRAGYTWEKPKEAG